MKTLLLLLSLTASQAFAGWTLDNTDSRLSFVTVKAQNVAEVHSFTQLSGEVDSTGIATVTIQLASVDTLIEIRDERMREVLFQTDIFSYRHGVYRDQFSRTRRPCGWHKHGSTRETHAVIGRTGVSLDR